MAILYYKYYKNSTKGYENYSIIISLRVYISLQATFLSNCLPKLHINYVRDKI